MKNRTRLKKSVWLPIGLALYALSMTLIFAPRLIEEGQSVKLWISIAFELIILTALFFALRRKERLASTRPTGGPDETV